MARSIVVGKGKAQVEVGPELSAWVESMIAAAAPTTRAVLDEQLGKIERNAYAKWPVNTGKSKAALESGTRVVSASPLIVEGWIRCDVPYAIYVHTGRRYMVPELLRKPVREALPLITDALAADLARGGARV